ncbi:PopZ family protein, partial [Rhizobium ruizarguesonis]
MDEVQPTLLSEDAGLQISRSFEELAAANDGAERRSLDEIAEDMLRPMLREWLDDNLPTLVERLVREEIERVARGPRR